MREAERTRIARELHDELGQLLTGIKLDFASTVRRLQALKTPGDVVDKLQSATGQIDIAIAMVRRIASDLRPAALDHRDLGSAIEDEARRVAARSGLRIRVTHALPDDVAADAATALFRIFQEAVTNAVRHARATRVIARVGVRRDRLALFVRDDGIGLQEEQLELPTSLGVLGMHERARTVGGALTIRSRPGRGTLVAVSIPTVR
jgi:signal transduction histidine kinase